MIDCKPLFKLWTLAVKGPISPRTGEVIEPPAKEATAEAHEDSLDATRQI